MKKNNGIIYLIVQQRKDGTIYFLQDMIHEHQTVIYDLSHQMNDYIGSRQIPFLLTESDICTNQTYVLMEAKL